MPRVALSSCSSYIQYENNGVRPNWNLPDLYCNRVDFVQNKVYSGTGLREHYERIHGYEVRRIPRGSLPADRWQRVVGKEPPSTSDQTLVLISAVGWYEALALGMNAFWDPLGMADDEPARLLNPSSMSNLPGAA
ncbi:hypothetical protein FZEAL_5631 [Fusarium zealandicum]|uniref:Uncharacterized protein n=1 Tax=Fusarium zealandicum TaxID=1053134 RepID=A0A8H4UKF2_9HYPO|nr:hypothetical protein FZEAL_5631 [Fusarium zealandicum]